MGERPASVPKNVPTEPGLYLARDRGYEWWNMVVRVTGTPPYLHVDVWDWLGGKVARALAPDSYWWFGPKIDEPPVIKGKDEEKSY